MVSFASQRARNMLLNKSVGNNLDNDEADVYKTKTELARKGYYKRPVENGYIDRELDNSIRHYQRDRHLRVDGKMLPGGETEASLISEALGFGVPQPMQDELFDSEVASFAGGLRYVAPLIIKLGQRIGKKSGAAKEVWKSLPKSDRATVIEKVSEEEKARREEECGEQYAEHAEECNRVTETKGARAGAVCHGSASDIYSACLRGRAKEDRPPLQR